MALDVFLTFDGDCRRAVEFYAAVFKQEMPKHIMTYGQNPMGAKKEDRDRIIYTAMPLFGQTMMFSDCPSGERHTKGNNVMLTLGFPADEEIRRVFQALSEGGEIYMPLGKTFFNDVFGMVRDKFGVIWQVCKIPG